MDSGECGTRCAMNAARRSVQGERARPAALTGSPRTANQDHHPQRTVLAIAGAAFWEPSAANGERRIPGGAGAA